MSVEEFSSRNELCVSNAIEGSICLLIFSFLHEPTWTLRAEPDQGHQRHSWHESSCQLEAPCQTTYVHEYQVAAEAHKYAKGDVELEACDNGASYRCW